MKKRYVIHFKTRTTKQDVYHTVRVNNEAEARQIAKVRATALACRLIDVKQYHSYRLDYSSFNESRNHLITSTYTFRSDKPFFKAMNQAKAFVKEMNLVVFNFQELYE